MDETRATSWEFVDVGISSSVSLGKTLLIHPLWSTFCWISWVFFLIPSNNIRTSFMVGRFLPLKFRHLLAIQATTSISSPTSLSICMRESTISNRYLFHHDDEVCSKTSTLLYTLWRYCLLPCCKLHQNHSKALYITFIAKLTWLDVIWVQLTKRSLHQCVRIDFGTHTNTDEERSQLIHWTLTGLPWTCLLLFTHYIYFVARSHR